MQLPATVTIENVHFSVSNLCGSTQGLMANMKAHAVLYSNKEVYELDCDSKLQGGSITDSNYSKARQLWMEQITSTI